MVNQVHPCLMMTDIKRIQTVGMLQRELNVIPEILQRHAGPPLLIKLLAFQHHRIGKITVEREIGPVAEPAAVQFADDPVQLAGCIIDFFTVHRPGEQREKIGVGAVTRFESLEHDALDPEFIESLQILQIRLGSVLEITGESLLHDIYLQST